MDSRTALALLLLALATAGGCGDDSKPATGGGDSTSDKAMADVCAARDDIAKQVDTLKGLTLTTATKSEVTGSLQAIRSNLTKIRNVQPSLSEDRRKDVQAANEAFTSSVKETASAVGKTASLESSRATIKSALQQLETSYRSTLGNLNCS